MGKTSETVTTTAQVVNEAVALCIDNASRLLRNALILLNNSGSDGLTYALWSYAVEEFGKAMLLRGQIAGRDSHESLSVRHSFEHHEKFTTGLSELPDLHDTQMRRLLRVSSNTGTTTATFGDPLEPEAVMSIGASTTGLFEDTSHAVDPTVNLRMKLIYVDWDEVAKRWTRPGETLREAGVVGRWELNDTDLRRAVNSLQRRLQAEVQPGSAAAQPSTGANAK